MMLGPEKKAVVVRKPDGGLEEQVEERVLIKDKHPALGLPSSISAPPWPTASRR